MTITDSSTISELLHPRNVAIVGASGDEQKWGGRLLRYMINHRIEGELYPVNPRGEKLMGIQSYPSVSDCPGPVDMAILLLPSTRVMAAVKDCVNAGVKLAVIISSGFAESGPEGAELERLVVEEAHKGGMRIIGPNCMGLLNTHHNLAATTAVSMGYLDKLPVGGIGVASQSGALMGAMLARGIDVGASFSAMVSLGNQADIDQNDIFEYLIEDPQTQIISLYIEAVKDAERFVSLLDKAQTAEKPVLIVKSGRTAVGERAVKSHTASLAGSWPSFEAVCRAHGVYLFDNIFDLLSGAMVLQRGHRMRAPGVAVFSGSGGGGALFADALGETGLELSTLSEATRQSLATVLPPSHRDLPIDFGVLDYASGSDAVAVALSRVMTDDDVGAGIVFLTTQPNMDMVAKSVADVGETCDKPLLFVHGASTVGDPARQTLKNRGYGYIESPNDAIKVVDALWRREAMPSTPAGGNPIEALELPKLPSGYLVESDARNLIEAAGIPSTPWRLVQTIDEAVAASQDIGGRIVVKGVSSTLIHKSDAGAVKLDLTDGEAVRDACEEIKAALDKTEHTLEGFLVTSMVRSEVELIIGIQRDPDFGAMVMVGAGGVLVELMEDIQLSPAPISPEQAGAMLDGLRCRSMLEGWRGRKPADRPMLVNILVRLGQLAANLPALSELDINPLMIVDGKAVAADARAVLE